jgi:6-phosphogluconolactonase
MYTLLASPAYSLQMDWQKIHCFWGDERCVPPTDPLSNYRMAREVLLSHVPIPPENIHRMRSEAEPDESAREYESFLRSFFKDQPEALKGRTFDLLLLGVGEDGHTNSLFPGSQALEIEDRWVVGVQHRQPPDPQVDRISLTLPAMNAAQRVIFLATGERKAEIIERVLGTKKSKPLLPAERVNPLEGELLWLMDQGAASKLSIPEVQRKD